MAVEDTALTITRRLPAPVERVYAAFTDPALMTRWFCPGDMTVPHAECDPREGGTYRVEMRDTDGSRHVVVGVFREVVPNRRLVQTWRWETAEEESLVTIEFRDTGDGATELSLVHRYIADPELRERHREGWIGCLDNLAAFLDAAADTDPG